MLALTMWRKELRRADGQRKELLAEHRALFKRVQIEDLACRISTITAELLQHLGRLAGVFDNPP